MPKFRRAQGSQPAAKNTEKQELSGKASTPTEEGVSLSKFYAAVVKTTGEPWAAPLDSITTEPPLATDIPPINAPPQQQAVEIIPGGVSYPEPAGPATQQQPSTSAQIIIDKQNIGYKLLEKAGWTAGSGIGAREQGIQEPVDPDVNAGKGGLGYIGTRKRKTTATTASAIATASGKSQQEQAKSLPEDPLDKEDIDTKVKRVKQVMQTEADEKASKAISKYIYSAFNETTGEPTSDSNPLLRKNRKLSRTNPLL